MDAARFSQVFYGIYTLYVKRLSSPLLSLPDMPL